MSLLDALLGREAARALGGTVAEGKGAPARRSGPVFPADPADIWIGDRTALSVPSIFAAIDLIAGTIASIPFAARLVADNTLLNPQPVVVSRPDPSQNRVEWLYELLFNYLLRGEAFVRLYAKSSDDNFPRAMSVLNNDECEPHVVGGLRKVQWRGQDYGLEDIKHFTWMRLPGEDHGYGPIQLARARLAGDIANAEFSRRLFTDGGMVTSVLKHPLTLDSVEAQKLKDAWVAALSGSREPAVLSGGMEFETVQPNLVDLSLLDLRKEGALEVCRMYKVPPVLLAAELGGSSLTYMNVNSVWMQFLRMQMNLIAKIEAGWSSTIPRTQYVYADLDAVLRQDPAAQLTTVAEGVAAGLFTLPEGRNRLGLPPLPADDTTGEGTRTVAPTAGGGA